MLAIIFMILQLGLFAAQMLTPGLNDFGNPLAGGTPGPDRYIMIGQSGTRSMLSSMHVVLNYNNSSLPDRNNTFQYETRLQLYCGDSFGDPEEGEACLDHDRFEANYFNRTVRLMTPSGGMDFQMIFNYEELQARRGINPSTGKVNYDGPADSFLLLLPMPGHDRAKMRLKLQTRTQGGIIWTE